MIDQRKLLAAMTAAGHTQSSLARACGVSVSTIWRLVHETGSPRWELVAKVADALDIDPRELNTQAAA